MIGSLLVATSLVSKIHINNQFENVESSILTTSVQTNTLQERPDYVFDSLNHIPTLSGDIVDNKILAKSNFLLGLKESVNELKNSETKKDMQTLDELLNEL
ncbi:MAG: hypothetical protein ACJAWV_004253 [Flammeovirgaceae bacterium]|jgi:hypothetical protein